MMEKSLIYTFIPILFLFSSCLPSTESRTGSYSETISTPTPTPEIYTDDAHVKAGDVPYLQWGSNISYTYLTLSQDFADSLYLRGNLIHRFLRKTSNQKQNYCMVFTFTKEISQKTILLLPANISHLDNLQTNTREYVFQLNSFDKETNRSLCSTDTLKRTLNALYGDYLFVYTIADVYPTGRNSLESSSPMLYNTQGILVTELTLSGLTLHLIEKRDPQNNLYCSTDNDCTQKGFDCCLPSEGLCVKDLAIRSNVNTSSEEFQKAQILIDQNQKTRYDYPQFYYICLKNLKPTPIATPTTLSESEFYKKRDLYNCLVPSDGEMSICTISYKKASSQVLSPTPTPFITENDDRNFNSTYMGRLPLPSSSITAITYGGVPLTEGFDIEAQSYNDSLSDPQKVAITTTLPQGAINDDIKIYYKTDGSCIPANNLYQCTKYYFVEQNAGLVTDHYPNASDVLTYVLPYYADIDHYQVVVKLNDITLAETLDWEKTTYQGQGAIKIIPYNTLEGLGVKLSPGQLITIQYYTTHSFPSRTKALTDVYNYCRCSNPNNCKLEPIYDATDKIIDYQCSFPQTPLKGLPIYQTISMKSIPLPFVDQTGIFHDEDSITSLQQEGNVFKYKDNNLLKPNNETTYIGFNEIYGSLSGTTNVAMRPAKVKITNGLQYDIVVNQLRGIYSPCPTCGVDYYTPSTNPLFPPLYQWPQGYLPTLRNQRVPPKESELVAQGRYRSDDLLFGRACFVPATMIPWSHRGKGSLSEQRSERMAAQHFLWANGYQRDWYGFNYASLIGSFDGVTWFSIGSGRRVKAQSTKLYLAINAYFADITQASSYAVTISPVDVLTGSDNSLLPKTDFESDGASCQRFHLCESDSDCITQLGWDYSCQVVTDIYTPWPLFTSDGGEVVNASEQKRLIDILVGGLSNKAPGKHCVYRGRGSACSVNYNLSSPTASYASKLSPGMHGCLGSNYCRPFLTDNEDQEEFNTKSARYGKSPAQQNSSSSIQTGTDTFGLSAQTIGRPYSFNGKESVPFVIKNHLVANNIEAICIPGLSPGTGSDSYLTLNAKKPTTYYKGDRVLNIGVSLDSVGTGISYGLNSCSILDKKGNYLKFQDDFSEEKFATSSLIKNMAASQVYTTNTLKVFNDELNSSSLLTAPNVMLESQTLEENRCLRAPGSPCFSDFDCAASSFISNQVSQLEEVSSNNSYNQYEYRFWTETLTCGQFYPPTTPLFNLKKNRCCRISGGNVTVGLQNDFSDTTFSQTNLALQTFKAETVDFSTDNFHRNSRSAPAYYAMHTTKEEDPFVNPLAPLVAPRVDQGTGNYLLGMTAPEYNADVTANRPQYSTLHNILSQTCCTKHWVRNFDSLNNGGKHDFGPSRAQTVPQNVFKCLAFFPNETGTSSSFGCTDPNYECNAVNFTTNQAKNFSKFMSSLELLGIPQVLIKTTLNALPESEKVSCLTYVDPENIDSYTDDTLSARQSPIDQPIPGTVRYVNTVTNTYPFATPEFVGTLDGDPYPYFSASDIGNFDTTKGLHQIFSPNNFSCCYPAGMAYDSKTLTSPDMCCTGTAVQDQNNQVRCCLPDYTNVTTYLNRYVSSEANDSAFDAWTDPYTGALPLAIVQERATTLQLCCSGEVSYGKAISPNPIPGVTNDTASKNNQVNRFLYLGNDPQSNFYQQGLRWNSDLYCVPKGTNSK